MFDARPAAGPAERCPVEVVIQASLQVGESGLNRLFRLAADPQALDRALVAGLFDDPAGALAFPSGIGGDDQGSDVRPLDEDLMI